MEWTIAISGFMFAGIFVLNRFLNRRTEKLEQIIRSMKYVENGQS